MKHYLLFLLLAVYYPSKIWAQDTGEEALELYEYINPEVIINESRDIASPAFEGREMGFPGNIKAQNWLNFKFRELGLKPLPELNGKFAETFDIAQYSSDINQNSLSINGIDISNDNFSPAYFSSNDSISAPLIHSDSASDYSGKIVLHFINAPIDEHKFNLQLDSAKAFIAKNAAGIIFIDTLNSTLHASGNPYIYDGEYFLPKQIKKDIRFTVKPFVKPITLAIPIVYLNVSSLPESWQGAETTITTSVKTGGKRKASNLLGMIPGKRDPNQYIILTTYFDSEGVHPEKGNPYLGANEHSSSIAAIIEMVNALLRFDESPDYSIVIAALNGSKRYHAGLEALLNDSKINHRSIKAIIELHKLGYSIDPKLSNLNVDSYNLTTQLEETFSKTWKHPFINLHVNSYRSDRFYLIPFISIYGDKTPFSSRIQDSLNSLNYIQIYRTAQYTIDLLWRFSKYESD